MAKLILTLLISISLTQTFGQIRPKGTYIGLVPIKDYGDTVKPQHKWFHLSELTFKGDSVYLEQSPVAIHKNDTVYSASDGGFYYYAGKLKTFKGKTVAVLTLTTCDYCPDQFIKFIPPKIFRDPTDSTEITDIDTTAVVKKLDMIENPKITYKALFIQTTKSKNVLLVDKVLYRRQNTK